MCDNGFTRCEMDHCSYFKKFDDRYIILLLYVDDMLLVGSSMKEINKLKQQLAKEFEMKDFRAANQILGMRITRNRSEGTLILSYKKYIEKVLSRFSLQDAKTKGTPLASHFKLFKEQSPKTDEEREQGHADTRWQNQDCDDPDPSLGCDLGIDVQG